MNKTTTAAVRFRSFGYFGPDELRYPNQLFTIFDNTASFTCPYCLEKACRFKECTKIWIQPKILTEGRLENLKRDFPKYDWDQIINHIRYGKWEDIEKLENDFGILIPKGKDNEMKILVKVITAMILKVQAKNRITGTRKEAQAIQQEQVQD
ncbi:hypothetical protein RFI_31228 [Reticulomyxa filosa]|uniref:Uncharacterized protein n=1 Tax=Reticulomyxa filosa TaxID=46433 RepID=X6LZK1_RETFI|nr:hypothetical protein RFI_31228 [Reticulomyxa filosa]|eukprot:ETO06165.1 hypothetical protein RFI_31228 [Reticulomyxa filosa]